MKTLDLAPATTSARPRSHIGSAVGLFHSITLVGAGIGCVAAFGMLVPWLGERSAIGALTAVNGAVLLSAVVARREPRDAATASVALAVPARPPVLGFVPVLALAAAGGVVAWACALLFYAKLSQLSGWGAPALAAMLGPFLLGLAVGSNEAGRHCNAISAEEMMRRAVGAFLKATLVGLLFLPVLDSIGWLGRGALVVAMLMVFLAGRFWGRVLPYLAELGVGRDQRADTRTAVLYLVHTLAAGAGAVVTGSLLLPRLSLAAVALTLVLAGLAGTALLVGAFELPRWQKVLRGGAIAASALTALLLI
jgi:spermidine synthase